MRKALETLWLATFWLALAATCFGQTQQRIPFEQSAVYYAEKYGAHPGDGVSDTAAIQLALDAASAGGEVRITRRGTYTLNVQGVNPYNAANDYCLDLKYDNVSLVIGQGVTLQLANSQQTDAGGAVDMIVFRNRTNLYIGGQGRITGNTAGQTGWTGGYAQLANGQIIAGYATSGNGNHNVIVEGLQLDDHFSNTVNIANHSTGRGSRIVLKELYGKDCGEGFLVQFADNVRLTDLTMEDPGNVAVGDGIELAECDYFTCDGCIVRTNGAGSAFDFFGCKYGTLSDFVVDGWNEAFSANTSAGRIGEHITVGPGVIRGCASNAISMPEGAVTFRGITLSDCDQTPFQITTVAGAPTPIFSDCIFIGKAGVGGPAVLGGRGIVAKGCTFRDMGVEGLRAIPTANNDTPTLTIEGCIFKDNDARGLVVSESGGFTGFAPIGSIKNNVFSGNTTAPWAIGDTVTLTSLQMELEYGTLSSTLASGASNNLDIGTARTFLVTADAAGSRITGIARTSRQPRKLTIVNVSANTLTFQHESVSSTATNRFLIPDGGGVFNTVDGNVGMVLGQWDTAECAYDYSQQRWLVLRSGSLYKESTTGISALVNSTNAQTLRTYSTMTSNTNYQRSVLTSAKVTKTADAGATVTATNLIPDGAFVIGVTTRVNTALGTTNGTTGYTVGDGSDADLWGAIVGTAAGTESKSSNFTAVGATGLYTANQSVVITATGGNFDGTGVIEVIAHYLTTEAN